MRLTPLLARPLARFAVHAPRACDAWFGTAPRIIAHRGASSTAPENTHAAFALAAQGGFGMELDVGLSADGTPWVLHDDTLDRTTNLRGFLDETPDVVLDTADAGSWKDAAFAGQPLPRLVDVLTHHAHLGLDVEIKSPRDGSRWTASDLGTRVAQVILQAQAADTVLVTSFNPYVLEAVRRTAPRVRRGQIVGTYEGSHLRVHERLGLQALALNHHAVPDALMLDDALVTRRDVRRAHRWGYRVAVWTVDDPKRAKRLIGWGVDAVITNDPAGMAQSLRVPPALEDP